MKKTFFILLAIAMIYTLILFFQFLKDWANQPDPSEYRSHYRAVGY